MLLAGIPGSGPRAGRRCPRGGEGPRGTAEGTRRGHHLFRRCYLRGPVARAGRTELPRMLSQTGGGTFSTVNLDGECGGSSRKINGHRALCPRGYKSSSGLERAQVPGWANAVFLSIQRCGLQFLLVLLCSGASHQGECKLCYDVAKEIKHLLYGAQLGHWQLPNNA